jgi:hypothetical protein
MMRVFFAMVTAAALNACSSVASQPTEELELPQSVKSLYDEGIVTDRPTFVTLRGRLNLYIAAEPNTLLILRDLRDPVGYSANFVDDETAERIFEQLESVEEGFSRFPYLDVSPLEAFYGRLPAKPLFEAESIIVETLRDYENKCVEISGFAVAKRLHRNLQDLDFAKIVPLEFRECSEAEAE